MIEYLLGAAGVYLQLRIESKYEKGLDYKLGEIFAQRRERLFEDEPCEPVKILRELREAKAWAEAPAAAAKVKAEARRQELIEELVEAAKQRVEVEELKLAPGNGPYYLTVETYLRSIPEPRRKSLQAKIDAGKLNTWIVEKTGGTGKRTPLLVDAAVLNFLFDRRKKHTANTP